MEKPVNPLEKLNITPDLVRLIGQLDEFKGRWEALGAMVPDRLTALKQIATIESIGSSTRIEGATLSDSDVEKLLSGLDPTSFRSRDEQEVAGYAELMQLIFSSWPEIPLNENHIFQLHKILLKFSDKDEHHRGKYKTLPNHVEAFDENGKSLGVIFETATPFDTPTLMGNLVTWTSTSLDSEDYHPLLVIAVFVVRFLAIHPFQDGNGRLSRALTTLLLLRSGYNYAPYSSLERIIENNKTGYYVALRRAQVTLYKDESQLIEWITFFLNCLVNQQEVLERKLKREQIMTLLSPLSSKIMEIATQHGKITVRHAVSLTGANRNTVKLHLKQLVDSGYLIRRGHGKGTWYEKP